MSEFQKEECELARGIFVLIAQTTGNISDDLAHPNIITIIYNVDGTNLAVDEDKSVCDMTPLKDLL